MRSTEQLRHLQVRRCLCERCLWRPAGGRCKDGDDGSRWNVKGQGGETEGKCSRTRTWLGLPPLDNALLCSTVPSFSPFFPIAAFRYSTYLAGLAECHELHKTSLLFPLALTDVCPLL